MAWSPETDKIHMDSYYGYEIWRHKYQVVKPFLSENAFFQLFSTIKVYTETYRDIQTRGKSRKDKQTIKQTGKQINKGHKSKNKSIDRELHQKKLPNLISIHEWCYW